MKITFKIENNPVILTQLNKTVQNYHATQYPNLFLPHNYDRFLPWFEQKLAQKNITAIVVYDADQPIGYALLILNVVGDDNPFQPDGFTTMLIDQMSIEPNYQNQKIGTLLMEYIFNYCQEQQVSRIRLSVWSDNLQAKHFYKKMGFSNYLEHLEIQR
ncbi:GNAT family N-acetyltransferase [Aureispira anguillae]|uniref:GNAT family N-acetyltransferase n=1 Tax=Aureispira anguillae TaxID=2864201 RepID=A0A916DUH7_9BACT|nr:GNAT family N-acetyltransferase [Aureispira anguillae]BDS12251.1 GNAT family N-acetyltransferase [Aureispira anguillae]